MPPEHLLSLYNNKKIATYRDYDNFLPNFIKDKNGLTILDIGANVGLYNCYPAKKLNCRVFAFEQSVFNLEILARNIHLNGLSDLVTIIPLSISSELSINKLYMTSTSWGSNKYFRRELWA